MTPALAHFENEYIVHALERVADLLESQGANRFRVTAYRTGARAVRDAPRPVVEIVEAEGGAGLAALPGIGKSLASSIIELVETGRLRYLERLEGLASPDELFTTLPGIGPSLARRIHDGLHIDTLEELEMAAHDGRLEQLPGMGPRRTRAIRDVLEATLNRASRHRARLVGDEHAVRPAIALLLDLDNDYRVGAELGIFHTIAPRRLNPTGEPWLPILHEDRDGWHFTALYSNSARAHACHATHDWVIIHAEQDGHEYVCTAVTETHGILAGERVIRGRELECRAHHARARAQVPTLPLAPAAS